jgi:transposase
MGEGSFWLDDLQWSSIKGCLPGRKPRGPQRVDDRRVISGIIPGLQSGMRWRDCPQEYGPATTIYNRWHRCSRRGPWRFLLSGGQGSTAKPRCLCPSHCRRPKNCWPIRLMTAPRSGIGLHGAAPSRYKIERVFCRLKAARRIATVTANAPTTSLAPSA